MKTRLYIFIHNLNFDFPVIKSFKFLHDSGYKPESIIIENPPTILKFSIRDKNNKIIPKLTEYFYKTVYELNADEMSYVLPQFIVECINERNEFSLMIDQLKKKYYKLINVKVDVKDIESGQQVHQVLQNY